MKYTPRAILLLTDAHRRLDAEDQLARVHDMLAARGGEGTNEYLAGLEKIAYPARAKRRRKVVKLTK